MYKRQDNGDGKTGAGDSIVYLIKVENKGNVTLSGLSITDTLTDGNANSLSFNNSPTFSGSTQGSAEGTLKPNETANYTALYIISSNVANTPKVINSAIAIASSPGQSNNVSDTSDDGDDSDGNTDDDQTETLITETPIIELTKTATVTDNNSNGKVDIGDSIIYTIIAENKGNVNLSVVSVNDSSVFNSPSSTGNSYSMTIEPNFVSSSAGSAQGSLTIGETATYSATFIISSQAFLNEKIYNQASITCSSVNNISVSDVSDDGDDSDGNTTNDYTEVSLAASPSIEVTKTSTITDNGDGVTGKGDIVKYNITCLLYTSPSPRD